MHSPARINRKRQLLSEKKSAGSPAKKLRLNNFNSNFNTTLQFWERGAAQENARILKKPDNVIQVRTQRIIAPISVKLRDGTNLEISPGVKDERDA